VISVPARARRMHTASWEVVCLGEDHTDAARRFLATAVLSGLHADALLLEATPADLERIEDRVAAGESFVALLDANVATLLRDARAGNPDIRVVGIEERASQRADGRASPRDRGRDDSIASNIWKAFRPGEKRVILLGALHCSNGQGWRYRNLESMAPGLLAARATNVRVVWQHGAGPVEGFVRCLVAVGVRRGDLVIADTAALDPLLPELFPQLRDAFLRQYSAVVVYR